MSARAALLGTGYRAFVRPYLFAARGGDPEAIHEQMIDRLERLGGQPGTLRMLRAISGGPANPVTVAGIRFPGRVGVAAGLDKDGRAARAWGSFGFGFAELGTVTGLAQPGNDRPRVFRLPRSVALINRMGFNNAGAKALADHLHAQGVRRGNGALGIPLGISIGKSKIVPLELATSDYLTSLRMLAPYADYIAINVSSPNTPGLRLLQSQRALAQLLSTLRREAASLGSTSPLGAVPIFVKVAPDLTHAELDAILGACDEYGIRGLIATNTTLARDGLVAEDRAVGAEAGGLSGRPLTLPARAVVSYVAKHTTLPVIASGGVMSASDADALFAAGARLVQLYTGFIYEGPALVAAINALPQPRRTS